MLSSYRLPLDFDPARLKADLEHIAPDEWIAHFNTSEYEGQWSGVALRSLGGRQSHIYPEVGPDKAFAGTPLLARAPYLQEVLASFECPLHSVRLLKLAAGSSILEHSDLLLSYEEGVARIHVPVQTDERVAFFLNGERVPMREGETWYLNFSLPHRVENRSPLDRIHLVLDCKPDEWLRAKFPAS
jgi:hypothetical protein